MTRPRSTKNLFRATKRKPIVGEPLFPEGALHNQLPPDEGYRDALDFDPTPADATRAFTAAEGQRLREIGGPVWECAVGAGHMARPLQQAGFDVIGSDIVDRGHPGTILSDFYKWGQAGGPPAPASIIVTNPPYNEINARDGHGRWLRHIETLGVRYAAMLLNWDWPAARQNGMDALHERFPFARAYVCCWKIDFRGKGSPPQRNGWFVWDLDHQGPQTFHRLFREAGDPPQEAFL